MSDIFATVKGAVGSDIELSDEELISLHLEALNILPSECTRCQEEMQLYIVDVDKRGIVLAHESDLEKIS